MKLSIAVGYILLAVGVGIIFASLYDAFLIFNGEKQINNFVDIPENGSNGLLAKDNTGIDFESGSIEEQINSIIQSQIPNILPKGSIEDVVNSIIYSILIFIFITGGGRLAGVGVNLINRKE